VGGGIRERAANWSLPKNQVSSEPREKFEIPIAYINRQAGLYGILVENIIRLYPRNFPTLGYLWLRCSIDPDTQTITMGEDILRHR
jgi:hypothetical protein